MYQTANLIKLRAWFIEHREQVEGHLAFNVWWDYSHTISNAKRPTMAEATECGTCCCAAGWAAISHEFPTDVFRNEGLGCTASAVMRDFVDDVFLDIPALVADCSGQAAAFNYLFGTEWDEDFDHLIERLTYAIENNEYFRGFASLLAYNSRHFSTDTDTETEGSDYV